MIAIQINTSRLHERLSDAKRQIAQSPAVAFAEAKQEAVALEKDLLDTLANQAPVDLAVWAKRERAGARIAIPDKQAADVAKFEQRQVSSGVEVQFLRNSPPVLFRKAFGPNIPRLGRQVVRRKTRARLPIESLRKVGILNTEAAKQVIEQSASNLKKTIVKNVEVRA